MGVKNLPGLGEKLWFSNPPVSKAILILLTQNGQIIILGKLIITWWLNNGGYGLWKVSQQVSTRGLGNLGAPNEPS